MQTHQPTHPVPQQPLSLAVTPILPPPPRPGAFSKKKKNYNPKKTYSFSPLSPFLSHGRLHSSTRPYSTRQLLRRTRATNCPYTQYNVRHRIPSASRPNHRAAPRARQKRPHHPLDGVGHRPVGFHLFAATHDGLGAGGKLCYPVARQEKTRQRG